MTTKQKNKRKPNTPPHRRPEDNGEIMTAEQAASFAGVGVDTIRLAISSGGLKGTSFPSPIGIHTTRQAVLDFIDSGVGVNRDRKANDDATTTA